MSPDPDGICHFGWTGCPGVSLSLLGCRAELWGSCCTPGMLPVSLGVAAAPVAPPCAADGMGEKRILLQRDWESSHLHPAPTETRLCAPTWGGGRSELQRGMSNNIQSNHTGGKYSKGGEFTPWNNDKGREMSFPSLCS